MNPASFMRPLGSRDYGTGNVYEMRIYTYTPGTEFARDSGFELSVPPERKAFARVLAALIHAGADSEAQIIGQAADSKSPFGFQRRNRQHGAVRRSAPVFGQARRTP